MTDSPRQRHHRLQARLKLGFKDRPAAFANLGKNHPDYGMTPLEHFAAKQARKNEQANG